MPHRDPIRLTDAWQELTGLVDGKTYSVQNRGPSTCFLLETSTSTTPAATDVDKANSLPLYWGMAIEKAADTYWWAIAAVDVDAQLVINEAI